jgi:hypothetical protein
MSAVAASKSAVERIDDDGASCPTRRKSPTAPSVSPLLFFCSPCL